MRSLLGSATALATAGLMIVMFLVALDQTIVATAMPKVIGDLDGFELYAWVTTAYLLAETVAIPIAGKLGDIYGRKWITVIGVAIFLAGSALCGLADSMLQLIIFRGVQGLGGGIIFTNVFTLVADIYPDPARRAKYQGFFFAVFAVASVIGPYFGGWIADNLGWRWAFYVNMPIGLVALLVLPFVLPSGARRHDARVDFLGAAVVTVSVSALLLALSWVGEGDSWSAGRVVVALITAGIFMVAFIPVELRAVEPIIPFRIFRDRTMAVATSVLFIVGVSMFGVILYTPLFVQGVLGKTATGSGAVLTPLVLTMTVAGVVGGQLLARVQRVKPFMLFGAVMMALGMFLLSTLHTGSSTTTVGAYLFVTGIGLGLLMPIATLAVQAVTEPSMLGVATAATQFIRSIGATVGTALIGSFVTAGYIDELGAQAPAETPPQLLALLEDPNVLVDEAALAGLSQAATTLTGSTAVVGPLLQMTREVLASAIQSGFIFAAATTMVAIVVTLFMPDLRFDASQAAAPLMAKPAAADVAIADAVVAEPDTNSVAD